MLGMSPLQFVQIAIERPELAAQFMAMRGAPPPPLPQGNGMPGSDPSQNPIQDIANAPGPTQIPPGNFAQSLIPEQAIPGMGDTPAAPQSSAPFDMRANIPQWNVEMPPTPAPAGPATGAPVVTTAAPPQMAALPAPTQIGALPTPPAAATAPVPATASPGGPPTTPAAGPATPMDAFAQSLLGLAAPSGAAGGGGRVAQAPAPYIQGALAPATQAILQQLLASAVQGPGQLNLGR